MEEKKEHSNQVFFVMFCGSSSGIYLSLLVIYKAQHCYKGWTTGGSNGAIYDPTKSGWFNGPTFSCWFFQK